MSFLRKQESRSHFKHWIPASAGMTSVRGFSLLEVMVAVALLAIAFLTLINFQGQSLFRVARAEHLTQATFLAREKIAEILLNIEKEAQTQKVFPEDKSENGAFEKPYEDYKWSWVMRKVEIPAPAGDEGSPQMAMFGMVTGQIKELIREIKLTVTWEELGHERKFDVVTHIAKLQ